MSSADPNAPRFRWNGAKSVDVIDPSNYAVRVRGDHLQPLLDEAVSRGLVALRHLPPVGERVRRRPGRFKDTDDSEVGTIIGHANNACPVVVEWPLGNVVGYSPSELVPAKHDGQPDVIADLVRAVDFLARRAEVAVAAANRGARLIDAGNHAAAREAMSLHVSDLLRTCVDSPLVMRAMALVATWPTSPVTGMTDPHPDPQRARASGKPTEDPTHGEWIALDWYDGPLTEIAIATFSNGDRLVEVRTVGGWDGEDYRVGRDGERFPMRHTRLGRDEIVAMLDLIDGRPVHGFQDEPYPAQPPSAPTPSAEWTCLDNQRGLAAWLCVEPFYIEVMRHRDDQHEWSIFTGDASNRRTICVRNSTKVYESLAYAQVAAETELAKVFTAGLRTIGRGP